MKQPSPPDLTIPDCSGSPSANSAHTGRPPLWTKSAQRKMARLYVYTTLPLDTIVRVVHSRLPDSAPGLDSANKKLNSLLNKEPRWLHPRTESDMGRRVNQLSHSPPRLSVAADTASDGSAFRTSRSPPAAAPVKLERGANPVPMSPAPPSSQGSAAASPGTDMDADAQDAHESGDDGHFALFLRRTSCLFTSTDRSTGSFRQMLPGYSEPYVRTVKRLVKRFTAPISLRSRAQEAATWLDDDHGPQPFDEEPRPIPGDFLYLDVAARHQQCHALLEAHEHGRCPCFNQLDAAASPWLTAYGLTPAACRLLSTGPTPRDVTDRDSFGNTVLHFLAARGSISLLLRALEADTCDPVLNVSNTGGQTFLHLVRGSEVRNARLVCQLLHVVSAKGFSLAACDVYGRNLFHMLQMQGLPQDDMARISQRFRASPHSKRDAFGITPCALPGSEPMDLDLDPNAGPDSTSSGRQPAFSPVPSGDPAISKEARLLELVRLAEDKPLLEDADGGNGLHCLAMATLSSGSMVQKYRLDESMQERSSKGKKGGAVDSSSARLEFRYSLAMGLLAAGVDPNQYDLRGNTPLMAFAAELPEDKDYKTGPKILALLISHGADVHARNRAGETALHIAARCGRKLAVKTLVEHGASVHARDADGRSVLDVADIKMMSCGDDDTRAYAHFEACRAWLSSSKGLVVQRPTVLDEWGRVR